MRVGVLASGNGTNLQALLDRVHRRDGIEVVAVASDKLEAPALQRARAAGVPTAVFAYGDFADRGERDAAMGGWLVDQDVQLVVLAGYMQLLSRGFLELFRGRVINVHPALLPAFPGLHAVEQALDYGVKFFGVTVHFVDEGVDTGPVILQRGLELPDARSVPEVMDHLQPIEHELLPAAVRLIAAGAVRFDPENPRRVVVDVGGGAASFGGGAPSVGDGAPNVGSGAASVGDGVPNVGGGAASPPHRVMADR